jgi:hypothetical protein
MRNKRKGRREERARAGEKESGREGKKQKWQEGEREGEGEIGRVQGERGQEKGRPHQH